MFYFFPSQYSRGKAYFKSVKSFTIFFTQYQAFVLNIKLPDYNQ